MKTESTAKFYATKVGDMYGTGDRWSGVELTIIKDGKQKTFASDEVRELAGVYGEGWGNGKSKTKALCTAKWFITQTTL